MKGQRHYLRGFVLRDDDAGDDKAGKPLTIVAATEGRKGDGLNLTMDGADLERFKANPVVGYGHSYWGRDGLPIGRADKTWIDGPALKMDIAFDQDDDFATKVERKYRGGYMNAFSIGFDVWNIDDAGVPEGWELFEVSAVPLPMDPNATVESGRDSQLALVRSLTAGRANAEEFAQAVMEHLDALQAVPGRAGAVLSKKNKQLVQSARDALTELLDAAGSGDEDDDARAAREQRLLRLAGIAGH